MDCDHIIDLSIPLDLSNPFDQINPLSAYHKFKDMINPIRDKQFLLEIIILLEIRSNELDQDTS